MCELQNSSSKLMTFISRSCLFAVECTLVSSLNKNKKKQHFGHSTRDQPRHACALFRFVQAYKCLN